MLQLNKRIEFFKFQKNLETRFDKEMNMTQIYTRREYCDITRIDDKTFNQRVKDGWLIKQGQGRATKYAVTSKHVGETFENITKSLKDAKCAGKCDGACKPGYGAKKESSSFVERQSRWQAFKAKFRS